MHSARSGSTSLRRPWNRALGITLLGLPAFACSLSGAGLGEPPDPAREDPDVEVPAGQLRDASPDAAGPAQLAEDASLRAPTVADAMVADAQPPAAAAMPAMRQDASAPPSDAGEGQADAARDAGGEVGPICAGVGSYAARIDLNVAWAPTTALGLVPVLLGGKGTLSVLAAVRIAPSGVATIEPCGVTLPDFEGTASAGGELYGGDIADKAWKAPSMPSFEAQTTFACAHPGCAFTAGKSTMVLGARFVAGNGVWPSPGGWTVSGEFKASDDDGDGLPGLTLEMRGPTQSNAAGRPYAYPPLADSARARKLLIALSVRTQLAGALASCERIDGSSPDAEVHMSALGCVATAADQSQETPCPPELAQVVDANLPAWSVQSSRLRMRRLRNEAGCPAARAVLLHSQSGGD